MAFKLSVIVTSYNYEKYIAQTLKSLVNQTEELFEIIVIDDESQDNSVQIIKEFSDKYRNIRFYQYPDRKNHGLAESICLALKHVSGEYIAFCESDDFWDEHHVHVLRGFIERNKEAGLICNELRVINTSHKREYDDYVEMSNNWLREHNNKNIFLYLIHNYMPTFSSVCVKKDILMSCDFNPFYPQYLDFWLWRQLCLKHKVYFAENCITFWRKHNDSYDMKFNVKNIKDFLLASNKLMLDRTNGYGGSFYQIKLWWKSLFHSKNRMINDQMKILSHLNS